MSKLKQEIIDGLNSFEADFRSSLYIKQIISIINEIDFPADPHPLVGQTLKLRNGEGVKVIAYMSEIETPFILLRTTKDNEIIVRESNGNLWKNKQSNVDLILPPEYLPQKKFRITDSTGKTIELTGDIKVEEIT